MRQGDGRSDGIAEKRSNSVGLWDGGYGFCELVL